MAKKRHLKKDLNHLVGHAILEGAYTMAISDKAKAAEISKKMAEISEFRNQMITRINMATKKIGKKEVRHTFRAIHNDIIENVTNTFKSFQSMQ